MFKPKNNGDLVVEHLKKWRNSKTTPDKERMIHHALRSLIKQGHSDALAMIGYGSDFDIDIKFDLFDEEVSVNSSSPESKISLKSDKLNETYKPYITDKKKSV